MELPELEEIQFVHAHNNAFGKRLMSAPGKLRFYHVFFAIKKNYIWNHQLDIIIKENDGTRTLLILTAGSLAITPVPLHGASSNTLSNPVMICTKRTVIYLIHCGIFMKGYNVQI